MVFDLRNRRASWQGRVHRARVVPLRPNSRNKATVLTGSLPRVDDQPQGAGTHPERGAAPPRRKRRTSRLSNSRAESEDHTMSDHSTIEWTDATWNPVRGCTKISPGCARCYAEV